MYLSLSVNRNIKVRVESFSKTNFINLLSQWSLCWTDDIGLFSQFLQPYFAWWKHTSKIHSSKCVFSLSSTCCNRVAILHWTMSNFLIASSLPVPLLLLLLFANILSAIYASVSQHVADCLLAGPVRTTPEDPGSAEEAADSNSGWGAHTVEEEAAASWQRGSSWRGARCPPVLVYTANACSLVCLAYFI